MAILGDRGVVDRNEHTVLTTLNPRFRLRVWISCVWKCDVGKTGEKYYVSRHFNKGVVMSETQMGSKDLLRSWSIVDATVEAWRNHSIRSI